MYLTQVELIEFRNYETCCFDVALGVNVLLGANGQGKTNLIEAIAYLATLSSLRVATDGPLVRSGQNQAIIRLAVVAGRDDPRRLLLEVEINPGRANRARINGVPQKRARDLIGALRVVTFSPDDLAIVKGDPAARRQAIDDIMIARWPRLAGTKNDYDHVLRQRNAWLKTLCQRRSDLDADAIATLDVLGEQLAALGAELMVARAGLITDLNPLVATIYQSLAPDQTQVKIAYAPRQEALGRLVEAEDIRQGLIEAMTTLRQQEIGRGLSLVGPQRDEIELSIGSWPAKGYASHGESWSLALSWRLAAFQLLRQEGIEPVLILDDVFAELDTVRRSRLAAAISQAEQVIITAAVEDDLPPDLPGSRATVQAGTIEQGKTAP